MDENDFLVSRMLDTIEKLGRLQADFERTGNPLFVWDAIDACNFEWRDDKGERQRWPIPDWCRDYLDKVAQCIRATEHDAYWDRESRRVAQFHRLKQKPEINMPAAVFKALGMTETHFRQRKNEVRAACVVNVLENYRKQGGKYEIAEKLTANFWGYSASKVREMWSRHRDLRNALSKTNG